MGQFLSGVMGQLYPGGDTSDSRYEIKIDVNEDNYDFRINELSVDIDNNNRIAKVKYYNSNERSIELLRELLDF